MPQLSPAGPLLYDGQSYDTVQIGTQCWFHQNLNVGTMLPNGTSSPTLGDGQTEKWCYNNDPAVCASNGGLYTWAEANKLGENCDSSVCFPSAVNQGICPDGWHIPSDEEFVVLELYAGLTTTQAYLIGWRGLHAPALKTGGSTGFDVMLAGYRNSSGSFTTRSSTAYLWLSDENSAAYGWIRYLASSMSSVARMTGQKNYGYSVRCLKN